MLPLFQGFLTKSLRCTSCLSSCFSQFAIKTDSVDTSGQDHRRRPYSDSSTRLERPSEMKSNQKNKVDPSKGRGPISWTTVVVFSGVISIMLGIYYYLKRQKDLALAKQRYREIGKAKIGGKFELTDHNGRTIKSEDFIGQWVLIYFGFTHCPDICPDELEKIAEVVDALANMKKAGTGVCEVVPVFITVDPRRDGVKEIAAYVKEFHPLMIGLTGSEEAIESVCKAFRVYFSAGPRDSDEDYIVDHTIIAYLLNPDGNFVDYYGQTKNSEMMTNSIIIQMKKFEQVNKKTFFS